MYMDPHPHTTDDKGFDFMENTGQEEQDRDTVGTLLAVLIIAFVAMCQYAGLL